MASMKLVSVEPTIFFALKQGVLKNRVKVTVNNTGSKAAASLGIKGGGVSARARMSNIPKGKSTLDVFLPEIRKKMAVRAELLVDGACVSAKQFEWAPPKKWDVHYIHYSHHDYGYTDLPSRILADHDRFYDDVLDWCAETADWDKDCRFRYQVEQAWSLLHWAKRRPAEAVARMMKFAKAGQIEIPALFGNQTSELCGHEELHRLMYPSFQLKREYGVQVTSAMHNDVPGFSWGLIGAMADAGVKYFCMGVPRWYFTARQPVHPCWDEQAVRHFNVPGPWWWETPDGKRLLTWYNLHGMEFRPLGEHDTLERLPGMLKQFDDLGYQWNTVNFTVTSGHRDNSPASRWFADFIRDWNDKWVYPHFVNSTNTRFLDIISKKLPADTKVLRGEFPNTDYTVCATSTPHETGVNRNAHQHLRRGETFATIAGELCDYDFPKAQIDDAYLDTMYHDLHCWGMAHPGGPAQDGNVAEKCTNAYRALALAHDLEMKAVNRVADNLTTPEGNFLTLFNALAHKRSDVMTLPLHEWAPIGLPMTWSQPNEHGERFYGATWAIGRDCHRAPDFMIQGPFDLVDMDTGKKVTYQLRTITDPQDASPHAGERIAIGHQKTAVDIVFAANDIPAVGYKTYKVVKKRAAKKTAKKAAKKAKSFIRGLTVDNKFVKLKVDEKTGDVVSLFDKELGRELVDKRADHSVTQLIVRSAETNKEQRVRAKSVKVVEDGPVFTTIRVKGEAVSLPRFTKDITVYHAAKRVDVAIRGLKDSTPTVEAYLAFPFKVADPKFRFEASGSVIEPTVDQLPGSCTDYYAMQHWADVWDKDGGVVLSPVDSPMMEFGGLYPAYVSGAHHQFTNPEYGHEWLAPGSLTKGHMYALLYYNNYGTNFINVHTGEFLMRFSFTGHAGNWKDAAVRQFGWNAANPCWPVWTPGGQKGSLPTKAHSFIKIGASNVELSTFKPAEDADGLVVRIRETAGRATTTTAKLPRRTIRKATLTNTQEENIKKLPASGDSVKVSLAAFGTATIRLNLK